MYILPATARGVNTCIAWGTTLFLLANVPGACARPDVLDADMDSAPFLVDESYLTGHDIVYQQPMQLEAEGFPLGNGDMGGLVWTHPKGIEFQINKNDVWSGPEEGHAETSMSVPRHCARVKIDFGVPVFSWIHHMNAFEGRLSLAKGEASFSAHTGYSTAEVCSWLSQDKNVWVIECDNRYNDDLVEDGTSLAGVTLERIGSRAFGGWYAGGFSKNPEVGVGQTKSSVEGGDLVIEETGDGMTFTVACRVLGEQGKRLRRNNHSVEALTEDAAFTVLVSVVTQAEAENPTAAALDLLDEAERETVSAMKAKKDAWFSAFWKRSFLKLGDDYLENIYYMRRYLMACGSRGQFPVVFNGGLWRWNRDVINWMTPHHWNMQQQYWGLCAANDSDLMTPYLNTYFDMLPSMAELAISLGDVPGEKDAILLGEMHNLDGFMVNPFRGDMRHNYTPAAQVASRFYAYYEFTGDTEFLAAKAYPFMKKAANFYLHALTWDPGKERFQFHGFNYEDGSGGGPTLNPLSVRNCIEALFTACIRAAAILDTDADMTPRWQHVLDHLWERQLVEEEGIEGVVLAASDEPGRCSVRSWAVGGHIAYPDGIIGIDEKDSPVGMATMNFIRGLDGYMYSHHPVPIIAARMGDGDEALKLLKDGISEMQYFPQGLFFNCRGYPDDLYNLELQVNLIGGPGRPQVKWRDFFQCGMETISICGTAMQEMMLQSNEDKIRVFPAIPSEWQHRPLAFKLLARGGVLVASERRDGMVTQIGIKSRHGGGCRLQNPWPDQRIVVTDVATGHRIETRNEAKDVVRFVTTAGSEYRISPQETSLPDRKTLYTSEPNKEPKRLNERRALGLGKGFFVE